MTYRLKVVRYEKKDRQILLQNENGPCPLLAAANALLLRGTCALPSASVRNGVASLDDVANMLAEQAMNNSNHADALFVDELMQHIPKFQYGMDVNPCFTKGVTGYEFTSQLTAFDMLRCKLVHGWLIDEADQATHKALWNKTYNQLVETIIQSRESAGELERLLDEVHCLRARSMPGTTETERLAQLEERQSQLSHEMNEALLVEQFLATTGHQLTHYGLMKLHEHLQTNELCVFFRNNHFGTVTKHEDGLLYQLVTDLGYANSPAIVWEKLDNIDGDTEYVNSEFKLTPRQDALLAAGPTLTPEQMMAASHQNDADYQLALRLSNQGSAAVSTPSNTQQQLDEQEGKLMAAATEASIREYHGISTSVASAASTTAATSTRTSTSNKTIPLGPTVVRIPDDTKSTFSKRSVDSTPADEAVSLHDSRASSTRSPTVDGYLKPPLVLPDEDSKIPVAPHASIRDSDQLLALELQKQLQLSDENQSFALAQQLQYEEDQKAAERRQPAVAAVSPKDVERTSGQCVLS